MTAGRERKESKERPRQEKTERGKKKGEYGVKDVVVRERGSIALPREQARNALVT